MSLYYYITRLVKNWGGLTKHSANNDALWRDLVVKNQQLDYTKDRHKQGEIYQRHYVELHSRRSTAATRGCRGMPIAGPKGLRPNAQYYSDRQNR